MSGEVRNYSSGDAYALEFLGYQFSFGERDFEERVAGAAVKLGLVPSNDLEPEEVADLVELAADARISEPRSPLGAYLVRHWERLALVDGESLVYWLRKLVFRSAYLDHRVKQGLLDVSWDDSSGEFMIARESFEKSLPRFASAAPFLCLIVDHLLCPDTHRLRD